MDWHASHLGRTTLHTSCDYMQYRPQPTPHIDRQTTKSSTLANPPASPQHGLVGIPPETLTSVTSHLSPPALLALACTSSYLAHHVSQDSTWRAAFVRRFLPVSPDSELDLDHHAILLRTDVSSWRERFISRYLITRRWSRSKNLPLTHTPLMQSPVSAMLILPTPAAAVPQTALLTASTQYGIVARSFPLSGKILPGYLDASATGARPALGAFGPAGNWGVINPNHLWNGNPNAHFTPNITACALSSSSPAEKAPANASPTAIVAWGSRAGQVLITTAPRPMDGATSARRTNSTVRVRRCAVGEEHEGTVQDVRWINLSADQIDASSYAVSAGTDGRVKLWDAAGTQAGPINMCIWTSPMIIQKDRVSVVPDPCVRVEGLIQSTLGHLVTVVESGDIHVWTGFTLDRSAADNNSHLNAANVQEITVSRPTSSTRNSSAPKPTVKALSIDPKPSPDVVFLIAYEDEPVFYRVRVRVEPDAQEDQVEITPFGDPNFGPTSVVVPFFARNGRKESSLVLVGDHIGCVSLYAWDATSSSTQPIPPLRSFEAHRDGASVTALWWDGLLLVTGSSRGTTHVWDGMTFEHLRSFVNPIKRVRGRDLHQGAHPNGEMGREAVNHLLVNNEKDVLVVGIGGVVLAWHAGPVSARNKEKGMGVRGRHAPGTAPGTHGKKRVGGAKYIGQFEMRQTILESQSILNHEAETARRAYGREREHRAGLESLGLSEAEAVEYVLMLSRDEASAAERRGLEEATETEQGVFEGDFDIEEEEEDENPSEAFEGHSSVYSSGSSSASLSSISRSSSSKSGNYSASRRVKLNRKGAFVLSLGLPSHREPMEAGEEYLDFEAEAEEASRRRIGRELQRENQGERSFPPIHNTKVSPAAGPSSVSPPGPAINSSPKSVKSDSAWKVPLTKRTSFSSTTSHPSSSLPSTSNLALANGSPAAHGPRTGRSPIPAGGDDMDEDLWFALELSLVEARSRGENV
ncbi:hypothetical protein CPB84DRAFT_1957382 [Gymnopilus junonius]|uniref:F-box domain-containing protein n=1 Tax=Gymnopilus junonius TaxID=109634 RepID=A0A9P5TTB0_GYMJU|nr:hypothetical protein CPB84DRAFT_1957382 [Gymnopilus junonius]